MPPNDRDWLMDTHTMMELRYIGEPPTWPWFINGVWPSYVCRDGGKHAYVYGGEFLNEQKERFDVKRCVDCGHKSYAEKRVVGPYEKR